jgi:cytolethal distending toxin subunit A
LCSSSFYSIKRRDAVTIYRRPSLGLLASAVFVSSLIFAASVTRADPVNNEVMLVNGQTGKCLTIAGGSSTDNNVPSVQFDCDSDPSRRWRLNERADGIYQLRNVQTGKCLTIAGGLSADDNVPTLQFDCDSHPSRTWRISDVTGSGVHQIRNVQTNKCVTIAGGVTTNNNHPSVQFDCDGHASRRCDLTGILDRAD